MTKNRAEIQSIQCQTENFVFRRKIDEGCWRIAEGLSKVEQKWVAEGFCGHLLKHGRRMDENWTKVASLVIAVCFTKAKAQHLVVAVDVLCPSARLNWTVVITALAFYTVGAGRRAWAAYYVTAMVSHNVFYSNNITYFQGAPTAAYMWLYITLKGDVWWSF